MSLGSGCFAQLRQIAIGCISAMLSMLYEGNCKTRRDPLQLSRTEKLAKNWPSILVLKLFSDLNQTPCEIPPVRVFILRTNFEEIVFSWLSCSMTWENTLPRSEE